MNTADANRAVIERYYRAMREGDWDCVIAQHAPDVVCWMIGTSLVSGRFVGVGNLYDHMGRHVLGALDAGAEPYVKSSRIAVADDGHVVGLMHGGLPAKDGGRYDQHYLQVFRVECGRIAEIVEMYDLVMVETVLMRHRLSIVRERPAAPFDLAPAAIAGQSREVTLRLAEALEEALRNDAPQRLAAILARDAVIRVLGSTPCSGRHDGIEAAWPLLAGGMRAARVVCADRDAACLLMKSASPSSNQQYGIVLFADGDRIGDLMVFCDTVEAERALFGNRVLPASSTSIMPPFDLAAAFTA